MRRLTALTPVLVGVVLLAALWAANTRSVPFFTGGPSHQLSSTHDHLKKDHRGHGKGAPLRRTDPYAGLAGFQILGYLALGTFVVTLLAFITSAAVTRHRRPPRYLVEAGRDPNAFDAFEVPVNLLQSTARQLDAIRQGTPRNAIVACWWELERSCEETGMPRAASETPSEFTQRVLGRYLVRAVAIEGLAELYREARFSAHVMTEADRDRAVSALEQILADLRTASSRRTAAGGLP